MLHTRVGEVFVGKKMGLQRMAKNMVDKEKKFLNKKDSVNRAHDPRWSIGTADRSRELISGTVESC